MSIQGNDGTFTVPAASFTTTVTGAVNLSKSTKGHRAYLSSVALIAQAQSTPAFAVVTYLRLTDPGTGDVTLRMHDLCGTVQGDPQADQGTDGLSWSGRILLGATRNALQFIINNDSSVSITALWGWSAEVED